MKALMPNVYQYIDVKVGDLIKIVLESPSHFAAKRHITYNNDWILAYSPKIKKEFQLKVGEYKKVLKSS